MSTPTAQQQHAGSKPTPRSTGAAFTPSASSPPRSINSPAHLSASAQIKAHKSPHKTGQSGTHLAPSAAVHTPTPLGATAPSPNTGPDGPASQGRTRGSTLGGKSVAGSEANTPALSGLAGLGLVGATGLDGTFDALGGEEAHMRTAEQLSQRIREIANLLATRWGHVSQESLVACVPRVGLDGMWEDGLPDGDMRPGKHRNYIIAGSGFSVEIDWFEGRVKAVVLDLPNARDTAKRTLGRAAEILRRDLVGWDNEAATGRYVDLKNFAENLQRLAQTDQLGQEKASCFEALEGLFTSLSKIWEWEQNKIKPSLEDLHAQKDAELSILCERTGRPTMHANRRIGLKLDYWLDRRRAFLREYTGPVGSPATMEELWGASDQLYSLLIECQACDPTQYPAIRLSDDWVAATVSTGANNASADIAGLAGGINWVEPPVLVIPTGDAGTTAEHDPMDIDVAIRQAENSTQPTVRFVARFDPPVIVAYSTAAQIFQLVGQPLGPEPLQPYLELLFPEAHRQRQQRPGDGMEEHALSFHRTVYTYGTDGAALPRRVQYKLLTATPLPGRTLHEIPFAHPSQLVTILPVLRQWAFIGKLLSRTVGAFDEPPPSIPSAPASVPPRTARAGSPPSDTDSDSDSSVDAPSLARGRPNGTATLPKSTNSTQSSQQPLHVTDLTLTMGVTRLDLDVSPLLPDGSRASLRVLLNGTCQVSLEGTDEAEEAEGMDSGDIAEAGRVQRVLEMCEDLGVLGAWMERRGGGGGAERRDRVMEEVGMEAEAVGKEPSSDETMKGDAMEMGEG